MKPMTVGAKVVMWIILVLVCTPLLLVWFRLVRMIFLWAVR